MRLRLLCAAAFIARLRHRRAWRAAFLRLRRITVQQVVEQAARRGQSSDDAIHDWLVEKAVLLANIPRRPWVLHDEELQSSSADEFSDGD